MIPLQSRLSNGATVSDWLGTAGLAALAASSRIDLIRQGLRTDPALLAETIESLEQALQEVTIVRDHVAYVAHTETQDCDRCGAQPMEDQHGPSSEWCGCQP